MIYSISLFHSRAQKELVEKERKEEEEARKKRLGHAEDVRTQIREKEHARIAERNAFFEEGVKLDEEARLRRAKLEEVKKKKLETLRWVVRLYSTYIFCRFFVSMIVFYPDLGVVTVMKNIHSLFYTIYM